MAEKLLSVEGVSKSFPGVKALSNMHLDLYEGEVHALVGENGAGKSTLMKILSGIYKADTGNITYRGKEVTIPGPLEAQHLGISIIHQEINLMNDLTIAQNLFIGREPRTAGGLFLDEGKLINDAKALLADLHINFDVKTKVGDLTVAQQQLVEIAKAISYNGSVIIMDEPTSSLTPAETQALFEIIRKLKAQGRGIIYISHRLEELEQISDRVTVIRDGEYVATKKTSETNIMEVVSLMVGRVIAQDIRPDVIHHAGEVVLEVKNLSTPHLLKDISFDLRKGEILGFAGLMGAGRTEVARALIGADPAKVESLKIHGREVKIHNPSEAVANGIGYLSEDRKRFGLLLIQDVKFNVALSSLKSFISKIGFMKEIGIKKAAEASVKQLAIRTPSVKQYVKNLSGGNQQKVVIGKWLTRNCDILIFDEPTRGIDVGAKDEIYKLLRKLADEGKSIIMISSELPEVLRMSDRIVVMSQGRLTKVLNNEEADQNVIMQYATAARV